MDSNVLSAIVGALIGFCGSVLTMFIQFQSNEKIRRDEADLNAITMKVKDKKRDLLEIIDLVSDLKANMETLNPNNEVIEKRKSCQNKIEYRLMHFGVGPEDAKSIVKEIGRHQKITEAVDTFISDAWKELTDDDAD